MLTIRKKYTLWALLTAAVIAQDGFSGSVYSQTQEIQDKIATNLERQRLEGTWRFSSTDIGKNDQLRRYGREKLIFRGNTFERVEGKTVIMKGTYEIDPTKKPMSMDLTITEPQGGRAKVKQVYEIKGDRLTIATAKEGRPADLKPGKGRQVTWYERQYTVEQVMQILALEVDEEHLKQLRNPMSFKEFLGVLMESAETKGKRLPILVDREAFKADDPAAASIYDAADQVHRRHAEVHWRRAACRLEDA